MFVIPTKVGFTYRAVAMLVAFALTLASFAYSTSTAQAANLTSVSNTLTDSAPSVLSGHFISFTIPTTSLASLAPANDIVVTFPAGFTGVNTVVAGDLTVRVNGGAPVAITNFAAGSQTLTFDGVTAATTSVITIQVAPTKITNPGVVDDYEFLITTQPNDSGRTRVAIVNSVEVTAQVNTSFEFQVLGTTTIGTSIAATSTTGTTSATEIPFGVVTAGITETLLQTLTVQTNARNGFVVTVEQDSNLQSSNGADIDGFADGTYTNIPAAWTAPTNTLLNENTYGHWGLHSNDADLNSGEFTGGGGNRWVAASTTPRLIFSHNGPANGIAQNIGRADIAYQIQITPLQEAGDDYNTTLTYIATPTF